jgi:fatty acid desaturase
VAGTRAPNRTTIEWPTVVAIASFWLVFSATLVFGARLPALVAIGLLAVLGCFYLSLQHEVIHGHPTGFRWLNTVLVVVPLTLIEPFSTYRQTHIAHHASDLTNPLNDPESHYVSPEVWRRAGPFKRSMLHANRTLAVRMTLGPVRGTLRMWITEARAFHLSRVVRIRWSTHCVGAVLVVLVVRGAGLPLWIYLVGFVFGGTSLTALRSFLEHSAHESEPRSAVVDSNWFFGLLFLNNNLHYTHHAMPGAAWHRLPQLTRDMDAGVIVADGAGHYRGYFEIAKRHMFRSFCQPINPLLQPVEAGTLEAGTLEA